MAISFPGSKSNGQKFTSGNKSWTWNGSSWKGSTSSGGDAVTLDSLNSTQFLRSDADDGTTGKLGISTGSPFSKLQVGGHTFSGGNGMYQDGRVGISNHGNLTGMMLASTYNDTVHPEYGLVFVQGPSTSNYNVWSISPDGPAKGDSLSFHYQSGSTNIHSPSNAKVTFDGNGNVGIGTTNPLHDLHVHSSDVGPVKIHSTNTNGAYIRLSDVNTTSDPNHVWIGAQGNDTKFYQSNTLLSLIIKSTGNVGIGTTDPSALLHLKSTNASTGPSLIFENTNNAQNMNIDFWNNAGALQSRIQYAEGPASFNFIPNTSNGDSALYIAYGGNVGIGTTGLTNNNDRLQVKSSVNDPVATFYRPRNTAGGGLVRFMSDVGGTETIVAQVDSGGQFHGKLAPATAAMVTATHTSASAGAVISSNNANILWAIKTASNSSWYSISGDRFTILKSGLVSLNVNQDIITTGASSYAQCRIAVNGSIKAYQLITNTDGQWDAIVNHWCGYLNVNDYITLGFQSGNITNIDHGSWSNYDFTWIAQ